jgi:hypothetical protein
MIAGDSGAANQLQLRYRATYSGVIVDFIYGVPSKKAHQNSASSNVSNWGNNETRRDRMLGSFGIASCRVAECC